jgi:hypothetical protein
VSSKHGSVSQADHDEATTGISEKGLYLPIISGAYLPWKQNGVTHEAISLLV